VLVALGEEGVGGDWGSYTYVFSFLQRCVLGRKVCQKIPHHPLAVGGKVGCLRVAPSSPRGGDVSFVVLVALGEEGVGGDWLRSTGVFSSLT
jgi:hypothetical protein